MRKEYLGDSYDIVKRFWAERLETIAPLFAHPRFVPVDVRSQFERMVGMRVLDLNEQQAGPFGLFFDPHTGVPRPRITREGATVTHVPLAFIQAECSRLKPKYAICFDQSHDRVSGLERRDQRAEKRADLKARNLVSFYYVSHAPFLFVASEKKVLALLHRRLVDSGIPDWRFESDDLDLALTDFKPSA